MIKKTKYTNILIVLGVIFMLVLFLTASYAYFAITSINNATTTTITGNGEALGTPILTTSDSASSLGLNLTTTMMSEEKIGYKYYATPDSVGVGFDEEGFPTVGNGKYELATVSLDRGIPLDCNFTYTISATTTKSLGEDSKNVYVIITDGDGIKTTYTLYQLLSGVTYNGNASYLIPNQDQGVYIESYVENTSTAQSNLKGAKYTITITPKSGTQGFKCNAANKDIITSKSMAANYEQYGLWNSGLEGDGYRYTGFSSHSQSINEWKDEDLEKFAVATGVDKNQLKTRYSVYANNYICFGTTDKSECTSNPDKYMYRIIGLFQEENGDGTINIKAPYFYKLIKDKKLSNQYQWHSINDNTYWKNSDLYKGLNGNYFLTNSEYDYMQNNKWLDKIIDWHWTSVDTIRNEGPDYLYNNPQVIYLHENNRLSKVNSTCAKNKTESSLTICSIGTWTYNKAKIGLPMVSDLFMASGAEMMNMPTNEKMNALTVFHGFAWNVGGMPITISSQSSVSYVAHPWVGAQSSNKNSKYNVMPVFYLKSTVELNSGTGTETDPYILK